MEVAPTAHYSMGGISVNPEDHATCIDGLYAAGEVAGGLVIRYPKFLFLANLQVIMPVNILVEFLQSLSRRIK